MSNPFEQNNIAVSVGSDEEAKQLRADFEEVVARVNMDLIRQRMRPSDPLSVEAAVEQAERSVDYHLGFFKENSALQALAPALKQRFRQGIEAQAGTQR